MRDFLRDFVREGASAIIPITLTVLVLHWTIVPMGEHILRFLVSALMVGAGIGLFLAGVRIGLVPLGEFIGSSLGKRGSLPLILIVGLVLGMVVTAADPDVRVLAQMVTSVNPAVSGTSIIAAVSVGVGTFVVVSVLRVVLQVPLRALLMGLYLLLFALTAFVSPGLVPVAFDSGGVTTGPVITPFIIALSVGIVSSLSTGDRLADSFGLVALACVGPILAVLLLGIFG